MYKFLSGITQSDHENSINAIALYQTDKVTNLISYYFQ